MITVNLFDDTFRHDVCSTAGKTPRHVRYVRDQMAWDGITLFTDGYLRRPVVDLVRSRYKIGWLHEPPCLHPEDYRDIPVDKFNFIMTYDAGLLTQPGYRFAPYGGVWLPRVEWGLRNKTGLVSFLVGTKDATEGHRLRLALADQLEASGVPVDFYGARGTPTGYGWQAKRTVLADYAFSIIVETCKLDGEFTEILLDALAVGTIPIFWGAADIGKFFDTRGMLIFDQAEEVRAILKSLDFNLYHKLLPYAAANLRAVYEYEIAEDWIYIHILEGMV